MSVIIGPGQPEGGESWSQPLFLNLRGDNHSTNSCTGSAYNNNNNNRLFPICFYNLCFSLIYFVDLFMYRKKANPGTIRLYLSRIGRPD